jgi:PAS domain-containing protein
MIEGENTVLKQTTIRLPKSLLEEFQEAVRSQGEKNMNAVIQRLVQDWIRNPSILSRDDDDILRFGENNSLAIQKAYLRFLPVAAIIKELKGRIIFANPRFQHFVKRSDLAGQLSGDLWPGAAELIEVFDQKVRDEKQPIFCLDVVSFEGKEFRNFVIRFPIVEQGEIKWTATIGFDFDHIREKSKLLGPKAHTEQRACRFSDDSLIFFPAVASPDSLLTSFFDCLPVVATVKNSIGKLLWVNKEYYALTGKNDALGHFSSDNWPAAVANLIMAHDQMVRETKATFASLESLNEKDLPPARRNEGERLNIRFPIFDSRGNVAMTGSLGLDYGLITRAIERLILLSGKEAMVTLSELGSKFDPS